MRRNVSVARASLAAVIAVTLVAVVGAAAPTEAAAATGPAHHQVAVPAAVVGHAKAVPAAVAPGPDAAIAAGDAATRVRLAAGVHFPAGGRAIVSVPSTGALVRAGALPVRVGAAGGPGVLQVTVADHAAAVAARVNGMIVSVAAPVRAADTAAVADLAAPSATASLALDYSGLANAGGDYAARLTLVRLPACALTTPALAACQTRTPVPFRNDLATHTITAQVTVPVATTATGTAAGVGTFGSGVVFATTTAPTSGAGSYTATSLSTAATWSSGGDSGDFTWSYPLRVPPANGGPAPRLSINYDSQSVDGRLPANNNQPSWIGDGFDLPTSYIERSYGSCNDDGQAGTYDECWKYDNATMVLNGQASQLIKDDTHGLWRPKNDDGSLVTRGTGAVNGDNDGEYWTVTTTDGTKYVFGQNHLPGWVANKPVTNSVATVPVYGDDAGEPCHATTFAASACAQAYRWNLDYVVDPHGNTETLWYTPEYNSYAQNGATGVNGTQYVRATDLARIDYGQTSTTIYSSVAPDQVIFTPKERCVVTGTETCASLTSSDQADWPDVPFDEICAANTHCNGSQASPTFFTTKRLDTVATQYWTGVGTTYQAVDSWKLVQSFPATGDLTAPPLWLESITHTGQVGTAIPENPVTFGGVQLTNRVDVSDPTVASLIRWRVHTITTETGSQITVGYMTPECVAGTTMPTPDANTKRCFPQNWTPPGNPRRLDWFQKYPVNQVLQSDPTTLSPTVETDYTYTNPAWHYQDDDGISPASTKTWSEWRGYRNVTTTVGVAPDMRTESKALYFQGMDGDKIAAGGTKTAKITDSRGTQVTDSEPLSGQAREMITDNGVGGPEISGKISDKFMYKTATHALSWGTTYAYIVADAAVRTRTDLAAGGTRNQVVSTTYDTSSADVTKYPATGLPLSVDDSGDAGATGDEKCMQYTYARNLGLWLMAFSDRAESVAVACGSTPSRPADVITDTRTEYDNGAFGAAPTKGDVTRAERLASYTGSTPNYELTSTTTYDGQGRPLVVTDPRTNATTTAYTPATGGPLTQTDVTNALTQKVTTTVSPAWGSTTSVVDANNKRVDETYDALGRLTAVWQANRSKSMGQNPNTKFAYQVLATAPSTVTTMSLNNDGTTYLTTSIAFYDAMLRARQSQVPASGGGRIVAQTDYDTLGRAYRADADYPDASSPSTTMANVTDTWPKQTIISYDGAGRNVVSTLKADGLVNQTTTTAYGGDRTTVTPPAGGVATTTITDIRGNMVERDDYNSSVPTGSFVAAKYAYWPSGKPKSTTDAAHNVWSYTYDQEARLSTSVDPDKGTTTFTYDPTDNVASTSDGASNVLVYAYDVLNRRTAEYSGSVAPANELASWLYDTVAKGQLTSSTRYVGGATGNAYINAVTAYDAMYRITGTKATIPGNEPLGIAGSYTTTAGYNLDGTLQAQTVPAGGGLAIEPLGYTYDTNRQITKIQGSTGIVQDATYTKLGQVQKVSLGASPTSTWVELTEAYEDGTGRLHNTLVTDDIHATDVNATYFYDAAGNTTEINDTGGGTSDDQCFTYGAQARLAAAWTTTGACAAGASTGILGGPAPYWLNWTYDANTGLRTEQVNHATSGTTTDTGYEYPAPAGTQPHALTATTNGVGGATTGSYTYWPGGATKTRPGANTPESLTWDHEGKLATVTEGANTTTNVYDADGTLLISHGPTQTVLYVAGEQIIRSSTGVMSAQREISFNGVPVALRTNAGLSWLTGDPHGTSTLSVDSVTQAVTHRYETPFNTPRGTPPPTWADNNGFLDKPYDPATGLTYLGAREYDTVTGRFLSVDTMESAGDPQSLAGYVYAGNSPLVGSDPTGLINSKLCDDCDNGPKRPTADVEPRRPSAGAGSGTPTSTGDVGGCQVASSGYVSCPASTRQTTPRTWNPTVDPPKCTPSGYPALCVPSAPSSSTDCHEAASGYVSCPASTRPMECHDPTACAAANSVAAGAVGAVLGLACGPFAEICVPVLSGGLGGAEFGYSRQKWEDPNKPVDWHEVGVEAAVGIAIGIFGAGALWLKGTVIAVK